MNNYYLLDKWGEGFRNCVSYTAWQANQVFSINTTNWGNGRDWNTSALGAGYTDDASPQVGDIAQWDATDNNRFGHVAYVYAVNNGVASYAEYNYARDGAYLDTYTSTSQGTPNHWIHLGTVPGGAQPSHAQMLADVTGDGKADAVVWYPGPGLAGNWYVAKANDAGTGFDGPVVWIAGTGVGSDKQFLEDVNGDGKADAVMYWASTGNFLVALSNGASFTNPTWWSLGQINGANPLVSGDVNGLDPTHKADAVVYSPGSGTWYTSLSSGGNFSGFGQSIAGMGVGSSAQMMGDLTGDGKADAVAYFGAPNGWWYIAPSVGSGIGFSGAAAWATGYGSGSSAQMLGDVTHDGKADAVAYFGGSNGWWYVAASNGAGFSSIGLYSNGFGVGSDNQLIGDVNGDGKADALVYYGATGTWYVELSNGYNTPFGGTVQWANGFGVGS